MPQLIIETSDQKQNTLPMLESSMGQKLADITNLYTKTKLLTYDPGFTSTASCWSKITFIDGENGILLHHGYPIQELASQKTFMDTAYLIINGELPTHSEREAFEYEINQKRIIPKELINILKYLSHDAHPMSLLMSLMSLMSTYYHNQKKIRDLEYQKQVITHIIATIPILSAMVFRHIKGKSFIEPDSRMSYTENFLHMCFAESKQSLISEEIVDILDKIFILHVDHEQNASTSSVRLTGSTDANPYACITSGIAALWGPSHGGANESVLQMLTEIGSTSNIDLYIEKAKNKDSNFKLMGFGHRVYKNYDPRASVLKKSCHNILKKLGAHDPLLEIALELESKALNDPYFIQRKLFPNVDFYSGIILKAIGFPTNYFTVLFALARTTGWIAQWKEMITDPKMRIYRPRQYYIGQKKRSIVDK